MVSVSLVGIGVMSLANMYYFSEQGIAETSSLVAAQKLAEQRVERLVALTTVQLPGCVVVEGCRLGVDAYAPAKPDAGNFPCTEMVDGMSIAAPAVGGAAVARYRVDTSVTPHPDQQAGAQVLTVSACWTDLDGSVHQVQVQRMLVPEV